MRFVRSITAMAVVTAVIPLAAGGAAAAAPSNDTSANAKVVTLGFSEVLDTSAATTDADDTQLNTNCGAPATDASVWYVIQGTGSGIVVDVSGSDYSAGVLVGTGTPGALDIVACGPGAVGFLGESGQSYWVLAIDDQSDGAGNGGNLAISFNEAPPPPTVDIQVNPRGYVNTRTGVASISGWYTCTGGDFIDLFGDARQSVGRFLIRGSFGFSDFGTCDGTRRPWAADVFPENGKFAGGKAMTVAIAFACGPFECRDGYAEQVVQLSGRRK
jgi:hypothetical protein